MSSLQGRSKLSRILAFLLPVLMLGITAPASSQLSGATLTGQVADVSKAIVPGAKIDIRNNATGVTRTVTSNGSGLYSGVDLQPGIYTVTVTAPGFATLTERGVQLNVGTTRSLDVALVVGEVSQRVEVSAGAADVETSPRCSRA